MASYDFLNNNMFRPYPFERTDTTNVSDKWIVDCNIVLTPGYEWDEEADSLRLTNINVSGNSATITISSLNYSFSFSVPSILDKWRTYFADETSGHGFGFITVGDMSDATTQALLQIKLQSAVVQNLTKHYVTSFNIANEYSTLYSDSKCGVSSETPNAYKITAENITGDINIRGGRFTSVSSFANQKQIQVVVSNEEGGGEDPQCCECEGESLRVLPANYDKTKEPNCADLLYSINGVSADPSTNVLRFTGTQGVVIEASENPHELIIQFEPLLILPPVDPDHSCEGE